LIDSHKEQKISQLLKQTTTTTDVELL